VSAQAGAPDAELLQRWRPRLVELAERIATVVRAAARSARERGGADELMRIAAQGQGDVTYGIDVPAEAELERWFEAAARQEPLSLLSEDAGWRHRGPDGRGGVRELAGFDHGGPHVLVDPIDGTRNLMTDLRSAWCVIALARPCAAQPWQRDVLLGVTGEIPDSRAARRRLLVAARGERCEFEERELADVARGGAGVQRTVLDTGRDARADHGYFPFFKYMADQRPALAELEARFFARLAEHEGADVRNCYDDQYISNAGQLVLLALGTYRMIADLRELVAHRSGRPTLTGKPYDIAGALVCAEAAGCVVTTPAGQPLDFPLDATTPIGFVGWTNAATRDRLAPHLAAVLG